MLPDALFVSDADGPLRDQLIGIGLAFFELITSDAAISIQRMMMAPETDERLRELFWQAGPERTCAALADFLRARGERGELEIADYYLAAQQFLTLVKGEHRLLPARLCAERDRDGRITKTERTGGRDDFRHCDPGHPAADALGAPPASGTADPSLGRAGHQGARRPRPPAARGLCRRRAPGAGLRRRRTADRPWPEDDEAGHRGPYPAGTGPAAG
ncbi:hypothetical protein G6F57_018458 [Rhizopus arrhizus]|nr:hypothetical protein G6F57_018458 [Rhizopus arrhizus]